MAKDQNNKSKISNSIIIIGLIMVAILIIIAVSPIISAGKTKVISIDKLLGLDLTDDTVSTEVSGKTELKPETDTSAGGTTYSTIVRLNYKLDLETDLTKQDNPFLLFYALIDNNRADNYLFVHKTENNTNSIYGAKTAKNTYKHKSVQILDFKGKNISDSTELEKLKTSSLNLIQDDTEYKINFKYDYIKTMTIAYAITRNYVFNNVSKEAGIYKDIDVDFTNLTEQFVKNSAGEFEKVNVKVVIPVVFAIVASYDGKYLPVENFEPSGAISYPVIDTVDIKE